MRLLPLSRRQGAGRFSLVDGDDFEWATTAKWGYELIKPKMRPGTSGLASPASFARIAHGPRLHRKIMLNAGHDLVGKSVLHLNGWGLDNRKSNLLLISKGRHPRGYRRNIHNSATGWQVFIGSMSIGTFPSKEEAVAAYEEGAEKLGLVTPHAQRKLQESLVALLDACVARGQLGVGNPDDPLLENRYQISSNSESKLASQVY